MIYKRKKHWHMDATVNGVRYREALNTTDKREALALEKKRVSEIHQGKGASPAGRDFARKPFGEAAEVFLEDRKPHVAERTIQFEKERLRPLAKFFGETPLLRVKAEDIAAYQRARLDQGLAARTVNMEFAVLRRLLNRAKRWSMVAEDVRSLPERGRVVAKVLTPEQKNYLFQAAASNPDWLAAHCAAVLAVSTTCRGVELKHLRWRDVDLFERVITIRRSKLESGHRTIPLNADATGALVRLRERAEVFAATGPDHHVFPACEYGRIDPARPQKGWRTAWRSLTRAAGLKGFRFHDLRHQAITELAESGAPDATLMAVAGHLSRQMMEHYSHVRMAAKREA
ncbi:MAG: site-specific integrase, partial [Acidobacteriota bacterium]